MNDIAQSLRGWTPDDPGSEAAVEFVTLASELTEVVSSHQVGNERFVVGFNWDTTNGPPGTHRAFGLHASFAPDTGRCHVRARSTPTFGWAGHWLVGRGADPRAVARYRPVPENPYDEPPEYRTEGLYSGTHYGLARPGGRTTRLIEDRVRRCGDRYRILRSNSAYPSFFNGEREANFVLLHDRHPQAVSRRFVIQLETITVKRTTYAITEGGFHTLAQARHWLDRIDARAGTVPPLPVTDPATGLAPRGIPAPVRGRATPVQSAASVARRTR
ncbi:hypothetical protein ACFVVA_13035 [Kitasatospora sp. NPDC058048]|uniref:hypothetical protein n=1 Tax=Kitasatospora sp. NPDC058048 TaxID=3346313 RepID=UPI0036DF905E